MPSGSYGWRRITESIEANDTAFNTRAADSTANRIDASASYPYNLGRHRFLENGSLIRDINDTTALADLEGKMQVTASAGDEHIFGTREIVRYVPNYELLFGMAAWAETALTDGQHFAIEFSDDGPTKGPPPPRKQRAKRT